MRLMAGVMAARLRAFLHAESLGGIVLVVAAVAALIWANSSAADGYVQFWHQTITIGGDRFSITNDLQHWVNEGLMALFFFVIGLEIKRELVVGELRDRRTAVLPVFAAFGGVILPAVIFLAIVRNGEAVHGWGIPIATDIAFAVGILALLGSHVSIGAKLFLLSIAIADDILAIGVIAVFYSSGINVWWLAAAGAAVIAIRALQKLGVTSPWSYVPFGVFLWLATLESGVHATLAGVALGLMTPARPVKGRNVLESLERTLHPISAYLVIPVFALANAGVDLRGDVIKDAFSQPLVWAIIAGLLLGKLIGVAGTTYLMWMRGWGVLPADMNPQEILGVAVLGGIGFTVSLFIADLAFADAILVADAKVGILVASLAAAVIGAILLIITPSPRRRPLPADSSAG